MYFKNYKDDEELRMELLALLQKLKKDNILLENKVGSLLDLMLLYNTI